MDIASYVLVGFGGIGVCVAMAYTLDKVARLCFTPESHKGLTAKE